MAFAISSCECFKCDAQLLLYLQTSTSKLDIVNQSLLLVGSWLRLNSDFGIKITPKAHIVMKHIRQKIERSGKSLLQGNEEVVEASHQRFQNFWNQYKFINLDSDTHGKNLLDCVIDMNTSNI